MANERSCWNHLKRTLFPLKKPVVTNNVSTAPTTNEMVNSFQESYTKKPSKTKLTTTLSNGNAKNNPAVKANHKFFLVACQQ